jgi:hypothetical protein
MSFIIDANVTHDVGKPSSINLLSISTPLSVTIRLENSSMVLASDVEVPLGTFGREVFVSPQHIPASLQPYIISCIATHGPDTFMVSSAIYNLPENPHGGSATKIDRRTGAMLRQNNRTGEWTTFLPFGFYTFVDDIIANMSIIDAMAADGYSFFNLGV